MQSAWELPVGGAHGRDVVSDADVGALSDRLTAE